MYRVLCGGCRREVDEEYYAWTDSETAQHMALEADWTLYQDELYCWDCMSYDEEMDEYIPTSLYEYRAAERYRKTGPGAIPSDEYIQTLVIEHKPPASEEELVVTGVNGDTITFHAP
jgi:hypothetical protein